MGKVVGKVHVRTFQMDFVGRQGLRRVVRKALGA